MSIETTYSLGQVFVAPFWAVMILLPSWRWIRRIIASPLIVVPPALLYALLVLPRFGRLRADLDGFSLPGLTAVLGTPVGATIGRVHFLAFDLFVGRWIYLDGRERRINALLLAPVLILTLTWGPLGFLLYLLVRAAWAGVANRRGGAAATPAATISTPRLDALAVAATTLRRLPGINIPLTVVGIGLVLIFGGTLVGLLVDPRAITGAPAWLKPAKFAMSFALYAFTLIWLLGSVRGHPWLVRIVAGLTALGVVVEMACIALQAARGTTSHYNEATPLDALLWGLMGKMIMVLWAMNLLAALLLLRQRLPDPARAWALRLGLLLTLVGTAVAWPMTTQGGHSVGVPDGGPGLPLLTWSTVGGDLRAAHFVGIHALQVLPLVGWYLTRRAPAWLGPAHRLRLVCTAALAYLGVVLLLLWQALRGQSVIAPDAATLAAFGALCGGAALVVGATVLHARQQTALPAFGD